MKADLEKTLAQWERAEKSKDWSAPKDIRGGYIEASLGAVTLRGWHQGGYAAFRGEAVIAQGTLPNMIRLAESALVKTAVPALPAPTPIETAPAPVPELVAAPVKSKKREKLIREN